jgi:hypothetical protein
MTDEKPINIEFEIENFGPITNLRCNDKTRSLKMGIYANNGVGKTFFSRAFRLVSQNNHNTSNNLLTTDQSKGKFIFKITNEKDSEKPLRKLEIKLNENSKPIIRNDTGYIFHVYNSDYVAENLVKENYNPNDNDIKGYILGKSNIDLTNEKSEKNKFIKNRDKIQDKTNVAITKVKEDLVRLGVSPNTNNYKEIQFNNLYNGIEKQEDKSFESLEEMYQKLESMPDEINDVHKPNYIINSAVLNEIKTILCTPFEKSNLNESFVKKLKSKQPFIEEGLNLYHSNNSKCPFCKQRLEKNALEIIDLYTRYIDGKEAKIINNIETAKQRLERLKTDIETQYKQFYEINTQYNDIKTYFPYLESELKRFQDNENTLKKINELMIMLNEKKEDITCTNFEFNCHIENIQKFLEKLKTDLQIQIDEINTLNETKNKIKDQKLLLRKRMCNAKLVTLKKDQKENIQKIKELNQKISEKEEYIEEKENEAKINKRTKVVETLKKLLELFFGDKYKFDEDKFCIKFKDKYLYHNATNVLSDGEKGIVAFCYYLATVHSIIDKEEEYKKLFFVIDDPISSMDYGFVYAVAQSINTLNQHFDPELKRFRFIILTHNLDFMNILMSNRIICQKYMFTNNRISKWKEQLMLPYENHLKDIMLVSEERNPSHTTPNSIRHVLETICKFENREKNLDKYIAETPELRKNAHIPKLIQDLSHGKPRSDGLNEEVLINACSTVIDFISVKYPGHLQGLN